MNILGISGLANSVRFKRENFPGLSERELRISQGHDSAATLVCDGVVVAAAAEERFSRKKHTGDFPISATHYCLSQAGLSLGDIDLIAHGFDYGPYRELMTLDPITAKQYREVLSHESLLSEVSRHLPGFPANRVVGVNHHLAHAASAYFTSGWDECLVIVIDAMGEVQSLSVFEGRGGKLRRLHELSANDSIGIFYSLLTLHLGFEFNADEYKVMGLAPYGNPQSFRTFFEDEVELLPDGSIRIRSLALNKTREERENYTLTRRYFDEKLGPRRDPDAEISQIHCDLAAALQENLEIIFRHVCGHFASRTGLRHLALAGGVALNCAATGALRTSGLFDEIYVQPAAGDDGSALGAALWRAAVAGEVLNNRFPIPFLGPAYGRPDIEAALGNLSSRVRVTRSVSFEDTCSEAALRIADGSVVAWYRGRMEFGPRALGNRSILADPGRREMRDRINAMVKKREAFRPFAPAVSIEEADKWFEVPPMSCLPYMTSTVEVRSQHRTSLPAITHVNGSARIQTVSAVSNPEFHALLQAVGRTTGREIVLNTSFNVKGEPIVNTPAEAIATFLGSGIDFLFLDDYIVTRASTEVSNGD
jgi:carbamoyltransferase